MNRSLTTCLLHGLLLLLNVYVLCTFSTCWSKIHPLWSFGWWESCYIWARFQTIRHRSKVGQTGLWGLAMNWATVLGCAGSWNCVTGGTGERRWRWRRRYGNSHSSCWTKSVCLACCRALPPVSLHHFTFSCAAPSGINESDSEVCLLIRLSVCLCGGDSPRYCIRRSSR